MAEFRCTYCGKNVPIIDAQEVVKCPDCGVMLILPKNRTCSFLRRLERGNFLLNKNRFDEAQSVFEALKKESPDDFCLHLAILYCKIGLGASLKDNKFQFTINRLRFLAMQLDSSYIQAKKCASSSQQVLIDSFLPEIERVYRQELNLSREQSPCDIFIVCRKTGFSGKESMEFAAAKVLYDQLTKLGFSVYSPDINTPDLQQHEREPMIFSALSTSKVMIVLGSKAEAFYYPWVKDAWTRFIPLIKNGGKKQVIPAFMNITKFELPEELYMAGAIDFSTDTGIREIVARVMDFVLPEKVSYVEDEESVSEEKVETDINTHGNDESNTHGNDESNIHEKEEFEIGHTVFMGSYPQNTVDKECKEKIGWIVLTKTQEKALLISQKALDSQPFDVDPESVLDFVAKFTRGNTWKDSHLRKWLNKVFLNIAFNEEERLKILDSEISLSGSNGIILDKLFCLSIQEVGRYFHGPCMEHRKAKCTSYAKFNGAYRSPKGYSWWWLRSPGDNPNYAAGVDCEGAVFAFGIDVGSCKYAVRPAMWVRIEK